MAEYITKEQVLETECEKCPVYDCLFHCPTYNALNNIPTADVVERAEYDKLKSQLDYEHEHGIEAANNLLDVLGKLDFQRQENKKLRTKIDNARIQIEKLSGQTCYCSDGIIDEVLDILEEI